MHILKYKYSTQLRQNLNHHLIVNSSSSYLLQTSSFCYIYQIKNLIWAHY